MKKMIGSSFTYTLIHQMSPDVKHILINLEDLSAKEEINF